MDISEIIFTDGQIRSLKSTPKCMTMLFRDYADSMLEITFSGIREFEIYDSLSYDLWNSALEKKGDGYRLTLKDDEGTGVFIIEFVDGEYKVI